MTRSRLFALLLVLLPCAAVPVAASAARDARDIIRDAVEHWRDVSSYSVFEMTIHRPDWERDRKSVV